MSFLGCPNGFGKKTGKEEQNSGGGKVSFDNFKPRSISVKNNTG